MHSTKKELLGYGCLLGAIGLWSTVEVVTRTIHDEVQPVQLAWIRFLIGGAFLLALLPMRLKRRGLRLNRSILWLSLLMCWPGVVISNIALQYSLTAAGAAVSLITLNVAADEYGPDESYWSQVFTFQ